MARGNKKRRVKKWRDDRFVKYVPTQAQSIGSSVGQSVAVALFKESVPPVRRPFDLSPLTTEEPREATK